MPNVYVTNFSGHNYDQAAEYGDLVYMTKGYIKLENLAQIEDKLNKFINTSSKSDYLLLAGNNLLCVLATKLWLTKHKEVNILHWNGQDYSLYNVK